MQLFIKGQQKELGNASVTVIPNIAETKHTNYKFKKNIEALKLSRWIKQLEEENYHLKCLLEDLANDKLFQAQRIKELEHEKSNIK